MFANPRNLQMSCLARGSPHWATVVRTRLAAKRCWSAPASPVPSPPSCLLLPVAFVLVLNLCLHPAAAAWLQLWHVTPQGTAAGARATVMLRSLLTVTGTA